MKLKNKQCLGIKFVAPLKREDFVHTLHHGSGEDLLEFFTLIGSLIACSSNHTMEDFYNLGERLLKSVPFARRISMAGSSAHPEVPARAIAAAAVAKKIADLLPDEFSALTRRSSYSYASRSQGSGDDLIEVLEQDYHEEGFDPVRHMLQHLPKEGINQSVFDSKVAQKIQQLDVITQKLSKQVMEHHEEMVKGMQLVTELERDLQVATIIVKNGRRHLSKAIFEISQDLVVAANVRKKQVLLDMVPVLERVHHAMDIKSRLESIVQDGKYAKALEMCSECMLLLEECPELSAIQEMHQSMEESLEKISSKVDAFLLEICLKFDFDKYIIVIRAYNLLDELTSFADKVHHGFAQLLVSETYNTLWDVLYQEEDAQNVQKKIRLSYKELCCQVPEAKSQQCLFKTLEVLFDLMCSYYTMMTCHQHPEFIERFSPSGDHAKLGFQSNNIKHQHRRTVSQGDLSSNMKKEQQQQSKHFHTGSISSDSLLTRLSVTSLRATTTRLLTGSSSQNELTTSNSSSSSSTAVDVEAENRISSSSPAGEFHVQQQGHLSGEGTPPGGEEEKDNKADSPLSKGEGMVILIVSKALDNGRKTFWELVSWRLSALLSTMTSSCCYTATSNSNYRFLQSLEWANKFILAGEAFCGAEAVSLRSNLAKQTEEFFGTFHCHNIEILRMLTKKELWKPLSSVVLKSVNVLDPTGSIRLSLLLPPSSAVTSGGGISSFGSSLRVAEFAAWFKGGNPFAAERLPGSLDPTVNICEEEDHQTLNTKGLGGTGTSDNWVVQVEGDKDDKKNEDLLLATDSIDEDSQLQGHPHTLWRNTTSTTVLGIKDHSQVSAADNEKSLIVTNSSVCIFRYMEKYARLMQIFQPIASEVFKGLCQLFDLYFFSIYKMFGQREAFSGSQGQSNSYLALLCVMWEFREVLSPRLRATLLRISQGLEEQLVKYLAISTTQTVPESSLGGPTAGESLSVSSYTSKTSEVTAETDPARDGDATIVMTFSNLYALKERMVAVESLGWISQMLKASHHSLQAMLPQDSVNSVEFFYACTVNVVPDLAEHVYKAVARMLLNIGGYIDLIANVRWELNDLGIEHNGYIDQLLLEYKQYSSKLVLQGSLQKEMLELLLEYGVDTLAETLVEGLSHVRRCNNEGRALMSLDLQVLINGVQQVALPRLRSNLQIVETYIKAFYLPDIEFLPWVQTHPEYTRSQVIRLFNLASTANNWTKKRREDISDRIEAGDF